MPYEAHVIGEGSCSPLSGHSLVKTRCAEETLWATEDPGKDLRLVGINLGIAIHAGQLLHVGLFLTKESELGLFGLVATSLGAAASVANARRRFFILSTFSRGSLAKRLQMSLISE